MGQRRQRESVAPSSARKCASREEAVSSAEHIGHRSRTIVSTRYHRVSTSRPYVMYEALGPEARGLATLRARAGVVVLRPPFLASHGLMSEM